MPADLRKLTFAIMAFWPFFGVVVTSVSGGMGGVQDLPVFVTSVGGWILVSVMTPLIVWMAARYTFRRVVRSTLAHAGALLAMTVAHLAFLTAMRWFMDLPNRPVRVLSQWALLVKFDSLTYAAIFLAVVTLRSLRRARRAELAPSRLERRLAHAKWTSVRQSIDPVTIFATLEHLRVLVATDIAAAEQTIQRFCSHLRERLDAVRRIAARPRGPLPANRNITPPRFVWLTAALLFPIFGIYVMVVQTAVDLVVGYPIRLGATAASHLLGGALSVIVFAVTRATSGWSRVRAGVAIATACLGHALAVEGAMILLRPLHGASSGSFFSQMVILSGIVAYIVRHDDIQRRQNASRISSHALASLIEDAQTESITRAIAPHFLFNSLNSVLSLLHIDRKAAEEMLRRLECLLRTALVGDSRRLVSLREELQIANEYIEIERVRFRDALQIRTDIDERLLDTAVPPLVLQPLVENAIRHGVLSREGQGIIGVSAQQDESALVLSVNNDAAEDYEEWRDGIGLSSIRARLTHLYGADHSLTVTFNEGVTVRLRIPIAGGSR